MPNDLSLLHWSLPAALAELATFHNSTDRMRVVDVWVLPYVSDESNTTFTPFNTLALTASVWQVMT